MITFCIPIYNRDVTALVNSLVEQCDELDIGYQILCLDDCSTDAQVKEANKPLSMIMNVNYTEGIENLGRAKIRNKLARLARYDYMVFLDCDSQVVSDDFVRKYHDLVMKQHVVCGGRAYGVQPERRYLLHWNYGKKVESQPATRRTNQPYLSFLSNNFMVTAKVMKHFPFDESIEGYGYEDLEWAERLRAAQISIYHIDNPILHDGLDDNEAFVDKTEQAINNLHRLVTAKKIKTTRLLNLYHNPALKLAIDLMSIPFSINDLRKGLISKGGPLWKLQLLKWKTYKKAQEKQ